MEGYLYLFIEKMLQSFQVFFMMCNVHRETSCHAVTIRSIGCTHIETALIIKGLYMGMGPVWVNGVDMTIHDTS